MGRDGWTGLAVLAASLALFWATLGLERHPLVPVGPAFYPRIVLGVAAAFAQGRVIADVVAHRRAPLPAGAAPRANYALVVAACGIFAAYVVALPWLGFRLATLGFLLAMPAALDPPRTGRRWVAVAVVAAVGTALTYFLFERYLHVLLPRGPWTSF